MATAIAFGALFFLISAKTTFAQYGCTGQYGQYGGCTPSQSLVVDKTVGKPVQDKGGTTLTYVDNLTSSDVHFFAKDSVYFQIKVKNTSTTVAPNVILKDTLPSYLSPASYPGTYDTTNNVITISVGDLQVNEEKTYTFRMVVAPQEKLPANQGIICLTNKAEAYSGNISDNDSSQFCIEKQVSSGIQTVPATGPEMGIVILAGEFAALAGGIALKKKLG